MQPPDDIFQQAIASFQAGNLVEAERAFGALLRREPRHLGALNLLGILLTQLKRYDEAERHLRQALAIDARSEVTLYNYGIILANLKRPAEALDRFSQALAINATVPDTWNSRGAVLSDLKRFEDAAGDFRKAIALKPDYADAHYNLGNALAHMGRHEEAVAAYDRALAIQPGLAGAWLGRGNACARLRRGAEALAAYDKALAIDPRLEGAWLGRGNVCSDLRRYDEAFAAYDKALALRPDLAEAWLGRGNVCSDLKRSEEAFAAYDKALVIKPTLEEAWIGKGNLCGELKRYDEAFAAFDRALAIKPDLAEVWLGRANVYTHMGRFEEAFAAYDKAFAAKPDLEGIWLGRGNACFALSRYTDAIAAYDKALAIRRDLAQAWLGRGNACSGLKRYDEAFTAYAEALAVNPDLAEAWASRASAHAELKQYDQAFADYDRAFALNPALNYAEAGRLHMKMHRCDWTDFDVDCSRLIATIESGTAASQPFAILAIPASPAVQRRCAELYIADRYSAGHAPLWRGERYTHDRIRLAYVSSDLHEHATAYLMAGVFEEHDRSRFEVVGVSFGPDQDSAMRRRLEKGFDRFVDMRLQDDTAIAQFIRESEIDIAIDLKGFTDGGRPGIFVRRPAPIQAAYIGFPGTMGCSFIDYIVADRIVIPEDERARFSEKVVYLPGSYQANDAKRTIGSRVPTRAEADLPAEGFVFCSFNNNYKITPDVFDVWMRLMRAVDGSVLWLLAGNDGAVVNLRKAAVQRGVAPDRLIFAPRTNLADHLARQRLADLFLDTRYCSAHTTASDALWAGLPVITCPGPAFAGRVAASLLHAVGLPELIAPTPEDYEALALNIARDPARLAALKAKLAHNRDTFPLFDTVRFTHHLESAYIAMWERHRRGERPESFAVLAQ